MADEVPPVEWLARARETLRVEAQAILLKVGDVMVTGRECPEVHVGATMREAVLEMAQKRGTVPIVDDDRRVVGVGRTATSCARPAISFRSPSAT
jgi:hypothetical protein